LKTNWIYDWLISCPAVLTLDVIKTYDYKVYVTLPLLYPRVILVGLNSEIREYCTIPENMGREVARNVCYKIAKGDLIDNAEEKVVYYTMLYGGLNLLLNIDDEVIPLTIELIDTSRFNLYINSTRTIDKPMSIESWIILGSILRSGLTDRLGEVCRLIGVFKDNICRVKILNGELLITLKNTALTEYRRIHPDNNPFRHVINYDRLTHG